MSPTHRHCEAISGFKPWIASSHLRVLLAMTISVFLLSGCAFAVRWPAFLVKRHESGKIFRGVFHVHSSFSHDSKADLEYIIRMAQKARLDFAVVTDHNNMLAAYAYRKKDLPRDPLLIFGNEISSSEGHLIALGVDEDPPPDKEAGQELIDWIHEKGGYAVIPHPLGKKSRWLNWDVKDFDGIEIYNFFHAIYGIPKIKFGLEFAFLPPGRFLKVLDRPMGKSLELWDRSLANGKVAGLGGTDAHVHFKTGGFSPENLLLSFQSVNVFALADKLEASKIIEALGKGRSFTAFEALGPAADFSFTAESEGRTYPMGGTLSQSPGIRFHAKTPEPAALRLVHNGHVIFEIEGTEFSHQGEGAGAYRVEVYKSGKPWIFSNPIYIEK